MAGLSAHGEGAVAPYELIASTATRSSRERAFPIAGLEFERRIALRDQRRGHSRNADERDEPPIARSAGRST